MIKGIQNEKDWQISSEFNSGKFIKNTEKVTEDKKWLYSSDVCEMLNLSPSSLQNLRSTGVLPFTQLRENGSIFYRKEDVENLLNKNHIS